MKPSPLYLPFFPNHKKIMQSDRAWVTSRSVAIFKSLREDDGKIRRIMSVRVCISRIPIYVPAQARAPIPTATSRCECVSFLSVPYASDSSSVNPENKATSTPHNFPHFCSKLVKNYKTVSIQPILVNFYWKSYLLIGKNLYL